MGKVWPNLTESPPFCQADCQNDARNGKNNEGSLKSKEGKRFGEDLRKMEAESEEERRQKCETNAIWERVEGERIGRQIKTQIEGNSTQNRRRAFVKD
jgi:hypothetical protein